MVRKIIADIIPNKKAMKNSSIKEKDILPAKIIIKESDYKAEKESIKEEIKEELEEEVKEELKKIKKSETNFFSEYFKNKNAEKQRLQRTPQIKNKPKTFHKGTIIFSLVSIIFGAIYWGGTFFNKADIYITSKHQIISYDKKQFTASKEVADNPVDFEIMITEDKKSRSITLTDSSKVSTYAKGTITLYNELSAISQKISAGAFLSDDSGKAYKTDITVTIPGYKFDKNKKIIPGQADVAITAFLPGETYNGSPASFSISAYKNTAKYLKIYGKLKSELTGGALGVVYAPNADDKKIMTEFAETTFKQSLMNQVKALVPPGYILYPDASNFSYKVNDTILSKTAETDIDVDGTLSVVLLKEKSLIDNIIKISLPNITQGELKEVKLLDLDKLTFELVQKDVPITKDMTSIPFLLSGNINAIWNPGIELLKSKIAGIDKINVPATFREDPGISSAIIKIFPPWQKYIPSDLSKINIVVKQ